VLKGKVECACTKGGVPEWEEERVLGRNETPEHVIRGPSVVDDLEESGEWGGEKGRGCYQYFNSKRKYKCIAVPQSCLATHSLITSCSIIFQYRHLQLLMTHLVLALFTGLSLRRCRGNEANLILCLIGTVTSNCSTVARKHNQVTGDWEQIAVCLLRVHSN